MKGGATASRDTSEHSARSSVGVVFSRDRAVKLDALLDSLRDLLALLRLTDRRTLPAGSVVDRKLPRALRVQRQIPETTVPWEHLLFLVDDNLFVSPFALADVVRALREQPAALGFSLWLGPSTTGWFMRRSTQQPPPFSRLGDGVLSFEWARAEGSFCCPLEVSSSMYPARVIAGLLARSNYSNPNTLELALSMAVRRFELQARRPLLLCFDRAVAFCNAVNKVQTICPDNRAGDQPDLSVEALADAFDAGPRIDTESLSGSVLCDTHCVVPLGLVGRAEPRPHAHISVVIPCHNYGRYLAEAIDSVLAQGSPVEIVVVDDASTDDTAEVAARYGDGVIYKYRTNGGPAGARNTGLELVSGDFVTFLDADDALAPDFLSECLQALEEHPEAGFAFTQLQRFGRTDLVTHFPPYDSVPPLRRRIPVCALFRRETLAQVRYDESLRTGLEDLDLYLTIAERGGRGILVDRPLVYYRQHEQQASITDRLMAAPLRRWRLHTKLMWRHRSLFSVGDWATFSYELLRDTAHGVKVRAAAGRAHRRTAS